MENRRDEIRGLYAIVDDTWVGAEGLSRVALRLLEAGVRLIQLRAKATPLRYVVREARAIREYATRHGAVFIMNDRVDVAQLVRADGVHLGLDDLPVEDARMLLGTDSIIGASTHDPDEARKAERAGADYVSLGPIYPTRTKKDAHAPRGLELLREVRRATRLPIVAIGGITPGNAPAALEAGADSVAMISELLTRDDPAEAAREAIAAIEAARKG